MDGSSSQGPFILAALIAVVINGFFSEPDLKPNVKPLDQVEQKTTPILLETEVALLERNIDAKVTEVVAE